MEGVTIVDHPLVQHKLTLMRDLERSTKAFRQLFSEIGMLLCYEVTRDLPLRMEDIETPLAKMKSPVLAGKGRDVLKYLDRTPTVAKDPAILRFDERTFSVTTTSTLDATEFARRLFLLTSTVVPQAHVSPTFDCALLDRTTGYRMLQP